MTVASGASRRGIERERKRVHYHRDRDWFALRAPASLGPVDVIAMKDGERTRFEELKSTAAGPFHSFGPKDRAELSFIAKLAGADAYLIWWPPRSEPIEFPEDSWP